MAVLTNPVVVASGGAADGSLRWAVVAFKNVTAADTYDFANLPAPVGPFVRVFGGIFAPSTRQSVTFLAVSVATNTNVTMNGTTLANDAGYAFIIGE